MIRVRLLPPLSRAVGVKELRVDGAGGTVRDALTAAGRGHPAFREAFFEEDGQPSSYYVCRVNGEPIFARDGWETRLADGDEVVLLAPIGGGQVV